MKPSSSNETKQVSDAMGILKAGIDRFFPDGLLKWSSKTIEVILGKENVNLKNASVQEELKRWEQQGIIRFVGRDDVYFEVLKPFP